VAALRSMLTHLLHVGGRQEAEAVRFQIVEGVLSADDRYRDSMAHLAGRLYDPANGVPLRGAGAAPGAINPWRTLRDGPNAAWAMCEMLRRLYRRGAITDDDFPEWARNAEVAHVSVRGVRRYVLQVPLTGAEVTIPTDPGAARLACGVAGILQRLQGAAAGAPRAAVAPVPAPPAHFEDPGLAFPAVFHDFPPLNADLGDLLQVGDDWDLFGDIQGGNLDNVPVSCE
jgi:hypothetical protein